MINQLIKYVIKNKEIIILAFSLFALPHYSAWVMERKIKKYIPENTKKRGIKILDNIETLINNVNLLVGVKKRDTTNKEKRIPQNK